MSCLAPVKIVGGNGGNYFDFTSESTGATLRKIWVWVGGWQVKAMKVWLTDGQSQQFGRPCGEPSEFEFDDGEHIAALTLWSNESENRLGAIQFTTNRSREFFARMTDWRKKTRYPVDVGSGICVGVTGRACADIDCLGFVFINTIRSAVLTNVTYTNLHQVIPQIVVEKIKCLTYTNNSAVIQSYKVETSKSIKKQSSWSVTNNVYKTLSIQVEAEPPEVVDPSTRSSFTVGVESTSGLENSEEKIESFSFPVQVPPGKTVYVDITIGRATVDLPYTGTLRITCHSGGVLRLHTHGMYKGVTYTDAKTTVSEK